MDCRAPLIREWARSQVAGMTAELAANMKNGHAQAEGQSWRSGMRRSGVGRGGRSQAVKGITRPERREVGSEVK